jgi:diguanylate cyclase (GGDEF)-like protein
MRSLAELKSPSKINPKHLHRLFFVDHLCLIAACFIALINIVPSLNIPLGKALPATWLNMRTSSVAITLCSVLSLYLSEPTQSRPTKLLGVLFGTLTSALAVLSFLVTIFGWPLALSWVFERNPAALRQGSLHFSYGAFFLVGIAILFASFRGPWLGRVADAVTLILSFLVFSLVLAAVFNLAGLSTSSATGIMSIPTLWCIVLLTVGLVLRRTEGGPLSLLWGYGTGSRIARFLVPVVVLLPMLREIARIHLLKSGWIPAPYAAAFLTSMGTFLGVVLVFILARIINRMQTRIQNDILRDELTGLYSLKGFYLLAEQAFRHSRRAQKPYSVIFVDMDNLKSINDKLGHSLGSVSLVETAKLLTSNFRDTEIIGRVGGDEFIVAGQFNEREMAAAVKRLREAVARKNDVVGQQFSISLSMGYAVAEDLERETLQSLVARADEAMYQEKRGKKKARSAVAVQPDAHALGVAQNKGAAFEQAGL